MLKGWKRFFIVLRFSNESFLFFIQGRINNCIESRYLSKCTTYEYVVPFTNTKILQYCKSYAGEKKNKKILIKNENFKILYMSIKGFHPLYQMLTTLKPSVRFFVV